MDAAQKLTGPQTVFLIQSFRAGGRSQIPSDSQAHRAWDRTMRSLLAKGLVEASPARTSATLTEAGRKLAQALLGPSLDSRP